MLFPDVEPINWPDGNKAIDFFSLPRVSFAWGYSNTEGNLDLEKTNA